MSQAPKLPRELRAAAWVALVLSALVGLASAGETQVLVEIHEVKAAASSSKPSFPGDPRMQEAMARAQIQALESMRGPRIAVLVALSFACGLVLVSSARFLWPGPLSRDAMRRIAGGAAIASGVLRTIDGAMTAVVGQRAGAAVAKLSGPLEGLGASESEWFKSMAPVLISGGMIALTVFFAGAFIAVGQYLRSDRARRLLEPR